MKKKIFALAIVALSTNVFASNLVVDDSGATFRKGITIGSDAVSAEGTLRFQNGQFQGNDGTGWISLASKEKVKQLEPLSDEEISDYVNEARDLCSKRGKDCSSSLELYNPTLNESYTTNIPTSEIQYVILSEEDCSPYSSSYTKYEGTDFTFLVNFVDPFYIEYKSHSQQYIARYSPHVSVLHKDTGLCFYTEFDPLVIGGYGKLLEFSSNDFTDRKAVYESINELRINELRKLNANKIVN
ncbi:hypothetical protein GZ77_09470 [Endozoicomonas montiporae]|uniref:Uncharacterized protein n=2 Tax=Endozoicomonas montiporae TaxID=1027273 RepID=A0A081N7X8_9GAMM|nr:hypothetical protein [Endozoicomonas montiporae]AMO55580.1 hypothetical protein EZMO1_1392 [Endozoicomonas montiporae CL-33]KEQ14551.1 hypothetical protein GZ77_09470 [Endozoicomonas montiporae]